MSEGVLDPMQIEDWSKWALEIADRIDPALSRANFSPSAGK